MNVRTSIFSVCAVLLVLSAAWAMAQAVLPPPVDRTVDFAVDVHPIFAENCMRCHGGGRDQGGLRMDSREQFLQGSDSGAVATPGVSAESLLVQLIASEDPDYRMPPTGRRLTREEIGIVRAWIDQGMPWSEAVQVVERELQPLHLREVSEPEPLNGETHPIDRFMSAYLADQELEAPALVGDAAFARRVHQDATGLLPEPEALRAFVDSDAPDKRVALVDQLLADNRAYAEHMMSFWNDHLRNDFQGTGYIDGGRKAITDWLYAALDRNQPYDDFVHDLVAPPDESSEGFIRGIVWRGTTATVQEPAMQAAASVSQVFLGINLKCASCHDSFIDDWKLRDAFGMANIFSEEAMELVRCDVATGEMADYTFLWPELGEIDGSLPRQERLERTAELITMEENGPFTRTIINRLWARMFGRGLIEPLDDIVQASWHPELLDWLARDFMEHGYDLKHTMRLIMTSQAYQWAAFPYAPEDRDAFQFRGPAVRKMSAEQFADAVSGVTGVWQENPRYLFEGEEAEGAEHVRAWRVPADQMMRALGRPNREQVTTRREDVSTTLQALELTNGETLARMIHEGAAHLRETAAEPPPALIERLFLHAVQRVPDARELALAEELLGPEVDQEGLEDLLWALAMLPEFQFIY